MSAGKNGNLSRVNGQRDGKRISVDESSNIIVPLYFNFPIYKRFDHSVFYCRAGYIVLLARMYYCGNCGFNRLRVLKNMYGETEVGKACKEKEDDVASRLEDLLGSDVQNVAEGVDDVQMGVDDSNAPRYTITITLTASNLSSHKSTKRSSNAFPNAVRWLGKSCLPCRRPCTGIKLLELIDHRRVGCYGLFRRKRVLNTVETNAETLIECVEDDQREQFEYLVNTFSVQYILGWQVTQSAGFTSAFHVEFPLQDADLSSIGFKATSDRNWSLFFNDCQITKKSVNAMALIDFLDECNIPRLRSVNSKTGVVTGIYSVTGGLTYIGDSRLVTTGGMQLDPTPSGSVKVMARCQYTVTDSGQVILSETNPVERIIAIDFLELGKM